MTVAFLLLILFLTFVYFEPGLFFPVLGKVRAAFIIPILALIAAVIAGARPPKAIQNKLFILLFIIAIVSLVLSPIPYNEINQLTLSHLYKAIALYFLVSIIIASKDYLIKFYYTTLGFGSIVGIVSFFTTRAGIESLKGGNLYRMVNFFGGIGDDPNEFGAFILAMLTLPIYMIQDEKSVIKRIIFSVLALTFMLCIIRTRSRGASLGLVVILAFLLWEHRKKIGVIIILLLMMIYAYFNTHPGYWKRFSTLQSMETIEADYAAYSRVLQNKYAIKLIESQPLTGVGMGNFGEAKVKMLNLDPASKEAMLAPHNSYLGLAAETGLISLLLYLLIIFYSIRHYSFAEKVFRTRKDLTIFYKIAKGLRIGLIGFAVSVFFLSEQYNLIFYQWVAFAVTLKNLAEKEITPANKS